MSRFNQRIKMLQIALQYTITRMKQATNEVREDDMPVFRLKQHYKNGTLFRKVNLILGMRVKFKSLRLRFLANSLSFYLQ